MKKLACCLLLSAFGARAAEPNIATVRLHLLTDDERIELRDGRNRLVCKAPCDAPVRVLGGDTFTIEGPGLLDSDAFALEPDDTDVTLRVRTGSRARRVTGIVLTSVGGGVVATWVSVFALFAVASANSDSRVQQPVQARAGRELVIDTHQSNGGSGPWLVLGGGVSLLVTGLVLLAGSHSTTVTRESAGPP